VNLIVGATVEYVLRSLALPDVADGVTRCCRRPSIRTNAVVAPHAVTSPELVDLKALGEASSRDTPQATYNRVGVEDLPISHEMNNC
jgi:hypothetical protein